MRLQLSDHALVRFLQRAAGADIEALRKQIEISLTRAAAAAGRLKASSYAIHADGLRYLVQDGTITTVISDAHGGANMHRREEPEA